MKASVLCPGFVRTQITDWERNRPRELQNAGAGEEKALEGLRQGVEAGMSPGQVADCVFDAIQDERFYILTHAGTKESVKTRMEGILHERNPGNP